MPSLDRKRLEGVNDGTNGGRSCWALPLTSCGDTSNREFTEKFAICIQCEFYARVREEEEEDQDFALPGEIMEKIKWLDIHTFREQSVEVEESE